MGDFVFGKPQSYEFQLFKGFDSGDGAIKFYNAQSVVAVLIWQTLILYSWLIS